MGKPKLVILEYGKVEDPSCTNYPKEYNDYESALLKEYNTKLSSAAISNEKTPMFIRSCLHVGGIYSVIKKYKKYDFDVICLSYSEAESYIRDNKDDIFVISMSALYFMNYEWILKYKDEIYLTCGSGNDGANTKSRLSEENCITAVGAINKYNKKLREYSSYSEVGIVDAVGYDGEVVDFTFNGYTYSNQAYGTSYACPQHATEIMNLMMDFYHRTNNKKMSISDVLKIRNEFSTDVEDPGIDAKTGYGLYDYNTSHLNRFMTSYKANEEYSIPKDEINTDSEKTPLFAKEARAWSMTHSISDGTRPNDNVTRAEMWTMLYRFFNLMLKTFKK